MSASNSHKQRHTVTLATWLALLLPATALAEQPDDLFSMPLESLMVVEVTTTSKYQEQTSDSPGNVHVFTREQIMQRGYLNVEDILQALPGVDVQKYSIIGTSNNIAFRGAVGNNNFLILQDGVRISSPAGSTTAIANNFPIYYAKQVEVLLGPASVVYGADAFAGVINIISMDAADGDFAELSVSAGQDNYKYGYGLVNQQFKNGVQLNAGIQAYRSQNFDFANDFPELYDDPGKNYDFAQTQEFSLFAKLRLNKHWQFGLNYATQSNSNDFTARPSFSPFDKNSETKIKLTTLYTQYDTDITENLESHTLLTLMNYELDPDTYFNNLFSGGNRGYKYANTDRVSLNQDFKYQFNDAHLLSSGLVYDYIDTIPRGPDLPSSYSPGKSTSRQNLNYLNTSLPIEFFENDYENFGAYIQDNWEINNQWRLVGGIRFDYNTFYGNSTNPRISAIFNMDSRNLFKLMYGRSFLAPAPDQASTSFGNFTGTQNANGEWLSSPFVPFRVPNPDLEPEKLESIELNYEHMFSKNFQIKVAPFYTTISNVILIQNDSVPDQTIPGADLQRTNKFANTGKSEIYGVDISLDQRFRFGKAEFTNWGSVSYLEGELKKTSTNTDLPMTAKYKAKAGSTLSYSRKYILTAKLNWIGKTNSNQTDPDDSSKFLQVSSYFTTDLHGEVKFTPHISGKLDIYNLADKKYGNAPFPPGFAALKEAPQPGRLIAATVLLRFK